MLPTDSKAISQFIKKAAACEDIVLKSAGEQLYSYTYVLDAADTYAGRTVEDSVWVEREMRVR